jgi:hypothetical protein
MLHQGMHRETDHDIFLFGDWKLEMKAVFDET